MEKNKNRIPKWVRCILWFFAIALLAFNSIYIKKLSDVKAARNKDFDATAFAGKLWDEKLPARLDSAILLSQLLDGLHTDPAATLEHYSNALDLGNVRYSLVKGGGKVMAVNEDDVDLLMGTGSTDSSVTIRLATEYVYGNALRDASGLVDLKDFTNTMDLNNISAALDKKVRETVLPSFRSTVKKGDSVSFAGAVELNTEHLRLHELNITPAELKIITKDHKRS